jgi:hypothetical protein
MKPIDREALELALKLTLEEKDKGRVEQVRGMLKDRRWRDVAGFCAFHRQIQVLNLHPWQSPPCHIDLDEIGENDAEGAELLKRMLAAGVSRYHPDPLGALAAVGGVK